MTSKQNSRAGSSAPNIVGTGLALVACFAAGIGVGALLWHGGEDLEQTKIDRDRRARIVSDGYKAADFLLVAADGFAKERGLTYKVLRARGYIAEAPRPEIISARTRADKSLEQALDLVVGGLEFSRDTAFIKRISQYRSAVEQIRNSIDGSKAADKTELRANIADRWFEKSSRLLSSMEQLLELVHVKIRSVGVDTDSDVALKLQRLALIMIDFAGRERGAVSGAIAENKRLDESFSQWALPAYQARINGIWVSIKAIAISSTLTPDITASIAKIEKEYFGELEELRVAIHKASEASEPYPVTAEEWFAKTSAVIETIVGLGREAGKLALARFEKLHQAV